MKKLGFLVLGSFFLMVLSCQGKQSGDIVDSVKKGHLVEAPKITVNELVERYQFIDASSVKWSKTTDQNKNEYAEVTASFDDKVDIVFGSLRERVTSGMIDVTVVMLNWHTFFKDIVNEESIDDEPDYDNMGQSSFFNCNGGDLKLYFTVDKSGVVSLEQGIIVFNMESLIEGETIPYTLDYYIGIEGTKNILLNNVDLGYGM